jgi:chorismate-pyruvate lyase
MTALSPLPAAAFDPLLELARLRRDRRFFEALPLDGLGMPEPERALLVHKNDMTSTLERFFNEPMRLRVLGQERRGSTLCRRVVLAGAASGRAREYGTISIHLENFPLDAHDAILAGQRPLGALLAAMELEYESRPKAFFGLRSDEILTAALGLASETKLWGRHNQLLGTRGPLADVLEILPPTITP